ncbi:hypothetical protein CPC735_042990 [Coccidioides posadasii C735 delta SOWgp]|uniref:Uncharacterized protein n=1 Tax=Coccidioides posadasii (strain C735) TaxID=222929 RepID=C5PB71_COCP7|nr:hypothetical protein CPC735_042990 [Coccidioides posadasii C735 delta SOWgp]EER25855.1 hypothetical protein CPC735_042990 [Coccidioides posadasii C735 delta SOWgp]|eukprot:XP_003068000.1 hypothetical protein CPC735_042990 [Coccidioides posadasii C735 delta SOWgp]
MFKVSIISAGLECVCQHAGPRPVSCASQLFPGGLPRAMPAGWRSELGGRAVVPSTVVRLPSARACDLPFLEMATACQDTAAAIFTATCSMPEPGVSRRKSVVQWLSQVDPLDGVPPVESYAAIHPNPYQSSHALECHVPARQSDDMTLRGGRGNTTRLGETRSHSRETQRFAFPAPHSPGQHSPTRTAVGDTTELPLPEKTYEKKPRRKTRKDRYDPKDAAKTHKAAKFAENTTSSRPEKTKCKRGKKLLEDQFVAPNVSQQRITLGSSFDMGLFARGRASSPVRRCELPDLAFSEMRFLSRHRRQHQPLNTVDESKGNASIRPPIVEISEYFSRPQSTGKPAKSCSSAILQQRPEPLKCGDVSNFAKQASVSKDDSPAPLGDLCHGLETKDSHSVKRARRSTTYYTWSDTNAKDSPKSDIKTGGDELHGTTHQISARDVASRQDFWTKISSAEDDSGHDPCIISKVYDMVFKNAYLGQPYEMPASSGSQIYTLEELQSLASRHLSSAPISKQGDRYISEADQVQTKTDDYPDKPGIIPSGYQGIYCQGENSITGTACPKDRFARTVRSLKGLEVEKEPPGLASHQDLFLCHNEPTFLFDSHDRGASTPKHEYPKFSIGLTEKCPGGIRHGYSRPDRKGTLERKSYSPSASGTWMAQINVVPDTRLDHGDLNAQNEDPNLTTFSGRALLDLADTDIDTLLPLDFRAFGGPALAGKCTPKMLNTLEEPKGPSDPYPYVHRHSNISPGYGLPSSPAGNAPSSSSLFHYPRRVLSQTQQTPVHIDPIPDLSLFWRPNKLY